MPVKLVTGVDMIEVDRVREAIAQRGERFLNRIYTARELLENDGNVESLAGRFAAKEAVAKALGCGIGDVSWQEVEIVRNEAGAPELVLYGMANSRSREMGLESWSISLSHTKYHAVAIAIGYK